MNWYSSKAFGVVHVCVVAGASQHWMLPRYPWDPLCPSQNSKAPDGYLALTPCVVCRPTQPANVLINGGGGGAPVAKITVRGVGVRLLVRMYLRGAVPRTYIGANQVPSNSVEYTHPHK